MSGRTIKLQCWMMSFNTCYLHRTTHAVLTAHITTHKTLQRVLRVLLIPQCTNQVSSTSNTVTLSQPQCKCSTTKKSVDFFQVLRFLLFSQDCQLQWELIICCQRKDSMGIYISEVRILFLFLECHKSFLTELNIIIFM